MKKYIKEFTTYVKKHYKTIILKLLIIGLFITADLLTKAHFEKQAEDKQVIKGFLYFTYVENTGAAFGIFPNQSAWLLIFSIIFLIVFIFYDIANKERNIWSELGFAFIFAGAIGNMVDRYQLGYVRDFISFDFINFPVFNIADVCITIGCVFYVIYLLVYLFYIKKSKKQTVVKTQQTETITKEETTTMQTEQKPENEEDFKGW